MTETELFALEEGDVIENVSIESPSLRTRYVVVRNRYAGLVVIRPLTPEDNFILGRADAPQWAKVEKKHAD